MVTKWAASCHPNDIQDAIDYVEGEGGGKVFLPEDIGQWNNETVAAITSVPIDVIGIREGSVFKSVLQQNQPAPFNKMFMFNGKIRTTGIEFKGLVTSGNDNVTGMAVSMQQAIDFRVDHNKFVDFPSKAIEVINYSAGTTRGVIDHNIIDNPYKDIYTVPQPMWAYGIVIAGKANTWHYPIEDFLGKYETAPSGFPIVYIEDNIISRTRHAIASNQGAWYVARYNTITEERPKNFGSIDVHGSAGGGSPGGRGLEAYNNLIIGSPGYSAAQAFWIRGGGGVIYDNNMQNIWKGILLEKEATAPSYSQVYDLSIWDNIMDGGTLLQNNGGYVENTDYFLYEKSGYVPYPYPHPLTVENAHLLAVNSNPSNIPFTVRRVA